MTQKHEERDWEDMGMDRGKDTGKEETSRFGQ